MVINMESITFQMYWNQYRLIEKRMVELSDYVMINTQNNATFSNQFILMYLSICSEIDSLANEFCKEITSSEKERFGINNKMNLLIEKYPKLKNWKCKTKFACLYLDLPFVLWGRIKL